MPANYPKCPKCGMEMFKSCSPDLHVWGCVFCGVFRQLPNKAWEEVK